MELFQVRRVVGALRVVGLCTLLGLGMIACSKHEGHSEEGAKVQLKEERLSSPADSVLKVVNAWARPTVAEQMATGAYMKIIPSKDGVIEGVSSTVADVTEIHEMKMEGDVMRMRALDSIPVKAGSVLELAPGGYHIMLMGLNQAVTEAKPFEIKIKFKGIDGSESEIPVNVAPGKDPAGQAGMKGDASGNHHKH